MSAPRLKYLSVLQTGAEKCTLQENNHATRVLSYTGSIKSKSCTAGEL